MVAPVAPKVRRLRAQDDYDAAFEDDPLVSVRVATYDSTDTLFERCLPSVYRQSHKNWELIIVGDGAPDESARRIASIDDPRVRFHNRPTNGPYPDDAARRWMVQATYPYNETIAIARGAWIAPLDDDDEWTDDHIDQLLRAARAHRAELVYGRMRAVIDGTGIETWFGAFPPRLSDFGFQAALYHAGLREEFEYDSFAYLRDEVSDWHLARRMWEAGVRFHFVDEVVGTFHIRPGRGPGWCATGANARANSRRITAHARAATETPQPPRRPASSWATTRSRCLIRDRRRCARVAGAIRG